MFYQTVGRQYNWIFRRQHVENLGASEGARPKAARGKGGWWRLVPVKGVGAPRRAALLVRHPGVWKDAEHDNLGKWNWCYPKWMEFVRRGEDSTTSKQVLESLPSCARFWNLKMLPFVAYPTYGHLLMLRRGKRKCGYQSRPPLKTEHGEQLYVMWWQIVTCYIWFCYW